MVILSWKIKSKQIPYYVLQTYWPMKKLMEEVTFKLKIKVLLGFTVAIIDFIKVKTVRKSSYTWNSRIVWFCDSWPWKYQW